MFIYYDAKLDRSVPRGVNFQMSLLFLIPCICKVWSMVFIFTCVCSENNIGLAGSESRLTQLPSEIERLNQCNKPGTKWNRAPQQELCIG